MNGTKISRFTAALKNTVSIGGTKWLAYLTKAPIIEKLKADHNVDFNIGTFRSYLSRFQNVKTDKKVNLDNVVTKDNQESYQPSESTDSKSIDSDNEKLVSETVPKNETKVSSFLSQFKDDKPVSKNTKVNKSRNKAKDLLNSITPSK